MSRARWNERLHAANEQVVWICPTFTDHGYIYIYHTSRRFHFGHWDVCDDHHVVVVVVGLNVLYVLLDDDYCGVGLQITVNNETLYVLITSDTDVLVRCR